MADFDPIAERIRLENEKVTTIPTLDELLARLTLAPPAMYTYFALVASGQVPPMLKSDNAQFAAQAIVILLNHVKQQQNAETNATSPTKDTDSADKEAAQERTDQPTI